MLVFNLFTIHVDVIDKLEAYNIKCIRTKRRKRRPNLSNSCFCLIKQNLKNAQLDMKATIGFKFFSYILDTSYANKNYIDLELPTFPFSRMTSTEILTRLNFVMP